MAGLLKTVSRKSEEKKKKKKEKKEKKATDKSASKKERRTILRDMSKGENQGAFAGLLSEGLLSEGLLSGGREYDAEEDAAKPIQFNNGGAKRYHYGSHHADIRGSTSLGVGVSKFTSCVMHTVELDDTWTKLSLEYSVSMDDIRRFNKMYSTDMLTSRKELMIPINDENKHKVDTSRILSSAAVAAARTLSPTESTASDGSGTAEVGPDAESPEPEPAKPSASDFLAQFDSSFGKTKSSVMKKSNDLQKPDAEKMYGSSSRTVTDKRIGGGIKNRGMA